MRLNVGLISLLIFQTVLFSALLRAVSSDSSIDIRPDGWTLISHEDGFRIESQPIPGHRLQAYRAKGILQAPIEQILEVLSDVAAADTWIPDLVRQQVVTEVSPLELITLSVYTVPFPFADRELLLRNHLRFDRERGGLTAEAVSIDHPEVPVADQRVRAHMFSGKTWLRPLSADRTEAEFVLMVEPRGRIPTFLADFGIRRMPLKLLKALEYRAQISDYPVRSLYRDMLSQLAITDGRISTPMAIGH
jgi:hypothetical protein